MTPRREAELLDGGSLYWVIKGRTECRQRIVAMEQVEGADGIGRCKLVLDPEIVRTAAHPKRPFQGWRYLPGQDAPRDVAGLADAGDAAALPCELEEELAAFGVV